MRVEYGIWDYKSTNKRKEKNSQSGVKWRPWPTLWSYRRHVHGATYNLPISLSPPKTIPSVMMTGVGGVLIRRWVFSARERADVGLVRSLGFRVDEGGGRWRCAEVFNRGSANWSGLSKGPLQPSKRITTHTAHITQQRYFHKPEGQI